MKIHELSPAPGSRKTPRRVGRGSGSGLGTTCGKGQKGQTSRSGGSIRPGFEGGQMPLVRRIPKRGFTNNFKKQYTTLNVEELSVFEEGTVITAEFLKEIGFISKIQADGLKILGDGELDKKLTVKASRFTKSAQEKIVAAGGVAEEI